MNDSWSRIRPPPPASSARVANPQPAAARRRERLREFQAVLSDKLLRAQSAPLTVHRLGLQIGPHRLLVDLADAGEILVVPDITPVPLTKSWYLGLANVRGNLLGIVDLSLFAGGPATPLDKESRILAFSTDLHFSAGILVSRMLGLRSAADLVVRTGPDAGQGAAASPDLFSPWVRALMTDARDVHWQELDLGALAADERFVDVARG
ncbi:MAG: chemotaxis protein CheW [Burkholderiaceae bacterium]